MAETRTRVITGAKWVSFDDAGHRVAGHYCAGPAAPWVRHSGTRHAQPKILARQVRLADVPLEPGLDRNEWVFPKCISISRFWPGLRACPALFGSAEQASLARNVIPREDCICTVRRQAVSMWWSTEDN